MLDHERLDVYQIAIEFVSVSVQTHEAMPRGNATLVDQLKRASFSIPLNIAEGSGKRSPLDKQRYYAIARGSAMECGAIFDVAKALGLIETEMHARGKKLLVRIVSMLTRMCGV